MLDAAGTVTSYTYDGLNNLTGVSMAGQPRTFSYSSLSRLLSPTNPKSGTITYTYDANGNLKTKTDARGVSETLTYDGLNRVLTKTYTDGTTPAVAYTYNYPGDTKGTLHSVVAGSNGTVYTHDPPGRVATSTQTTAGTAYNPFSYTYSLSDQLASVTYPSGRKVTFGYDSADRPWNVTGAFGTQTTNYTAGNVSYTAPGGFSTVPLGNGVTESYGWNDHLQQTSITAGNLLALNFYPCANGQTQCTGNNGNILQETISINGTPQATQQFGYDSLNRLTLAKEETTSSFALTCPDSGSVWCEQYSYDVYGNRTVNNETNEGGLTWEVTPSNSYSASTNRIVGWTYDNAGNTTAAPSGQTITYDAENRQTQFCVAGSGCDQYVYDGDGRRVQKITSSGTVTYVYDASGRLAAEYGSATTAAGTQYLTTDHLGSTRLVTNASGTATERHDYLPFGYEISNAEWRTGVPGYSTAGVPLKFTGKERDAETGVRLFRRPVLFRWTGEVHIAGPAATRPAYRRPAELEFVRLRAEQPTEVCRSDREHC